LRSSKTVAGSQTRFVWDLSGGLPLALKDGSTNHLSGPRGLPIERVDASGNATFFHHDHLGSTRLLTDTAGTTAATATYDAYGNQTASSGSIANPFGYAGQYTDAETGLQYLRARY